MGPGNAVTATAWTKELHSQSDQPLFPTRQGRPLSRYTVGAIVARHVATAAIHCPPLAAEHATPHTLRHYVNGWVMR
ncbi:MAG: hypothetical protein WAN02_01240, partial [Mycobacterium sp.]